MIAPIVGPRPHCISSRALSRAGVGSSACRDRSATAALEVPFRGARGSLLWRAVLEGMCISFGVARATWGGRVSFRLSLVFDASGPGWLLASRNLRRACH